MEFLYSSIYLIFTYLFSGTVLFLLIIKFLDSQEHYKLLYIISLGTGPVAIAWILEKLMYSIVGYPKELYISIILLFFSFLFIYTFKYYKNLSKVYSTLIKQFSKIDIIAVFVLIVLSLNILLPVIGNDASQYYYVSQNIFNTMDFHQYPLVESEAYKGYFPWTHPAGYVSLLTWGYFFTHSVEHLYLLKTINVFYAFLTYMLMAELLKKYGLFYSLTGALLIFMAPLYCTLIGQFHIDIFRIFLFFSPFVLLSIILQEKDIKLLYILVISLGFSAYAHSIGILSIFFVSVIILVYLRKLLTIKSILLTIGILTVILIFRYYQNYQLFGYIIGDKATIWSLDFIHYNDYLAKSRQLDTSYHILTNGIFRGFTDYYSFAFTFSYLVFIAFLTSVKDKLQKQNLFFTFKSLIHQDSMFKISLWVLGIWYFLTLLSVSLGGYSFIKNSRYLLTIYPFVIYILVVLSFEFLTVTKKKLKQ